MAINLQNALKNIKPLNLLKACNPDPSKAGKTLLVINAMGMVFAALSNTFAAAVDKNTSAEDKKFLVPAGFMTGIANIGLYFALTTKIIDHLQGKKAKIANSKEVNIKNPIIKKLLEIAKPKEKKEIKGLAQHILEIIDKEEGAIKENATSYVCKQIYKATKDEDRLSSAIKTLIKNPTEDLSETIKKQPTLDDLKKALKNIEITDDAIKAYKETFKSGFGVLGAFIGAIIGCAILTPIIRDISAYAIQKHMKKKNPTLNSDYHFIHYIDPIHVQSGRYVHKKQPLSMKTYMASTSGSLKI